MNAPPPGADLLAALRGRGWTIQPAASRDPLLPADLRERYPRLPGELTAFLESLGTCVNPDETAWFLCREDYRRTDGESFRWNEYEMMALEDQTAQAQVQIRAFWDLHFPFMLAVHSDYDYLAVSLADRSHGRIVHGCGPAFEDTSLVAPSFAQFLALFRDMAAGHDDEYPLSCFL